MKIPCSTRFTAATVLPLMMLSMVALAGSATNNLGVAATVAANCTISSSPLDFGAYDPLSNSDLEGTGTVTITCTKGSVTTVGLGLGSNASGSTRQMANGAARLAYEMYKEAGHTNIWGNSGGDLLNTGTAASTAAQNFTVYGVIPKLQDVTTGSYADTVVATVNF